MEREPPSGDPVERLSLPALQRKERKGGARP
nr:MAG TPA: hypothetical protein [Caudoviricetes sp.]